MWLIFSILFNLSQSLVMYIDEHLTEHNVSTTNINPHQQIGGQLIMSTLMSFVGGGVMFLLAAKAQIPTSAIVLALCSAVPMVIGNYLMYFYLLQQYPIQQVAPVFQLSALWLLIFELLTGSTIQWMGLLGIAILLYGTYLLDTGSLTWKIPTRLLLAGIPATFIWAISMFMIRVASTQGSAVLISAWQMMGGGILGILFFIAVKPYRQGFISRIKQQGKMFVGLSFINESLAEASFLCQNIAIALAPLAAYVSALAGMQSIFVLLLVFFFPTGHRSRPTPAQWLAIFLISIGVGLIEINR